MLVGLGVTVAMRLRRVCCRGEDSVVGRCSGYGFDQPNAPQSDSNMPPARKRVCASGRFGRTAHTRHPYRL